MANGRSQKTGIDFDKTFSPVARFDTVRTMLSVVANEGFELAQFDVKIAFLYGKIGEKMYMKQPDGYGNGTTKVCRLSQHIDNNYPTPLKFLFLIIFYSQCVQYYKNNKKDFII